MIFIDTSAWIEYFKNGVPAVVRKVDKGLADEDVAMGDLVFCEILQGIYVEEQRKQVEELLLALPQFEMVGYEMANKSAANYRLLRRKGIAVRKTMDVIIGTFCVEHDMALIHHDRDFEFMAPHIGLKIQ